MTYAIWIATGYLASLPLAAAVMAYMVGRFPPDDKSNTAAFIVFSAIIWPLIPIIAFYGLIYRLGCAKRKEQTP